MQTNKSWFFIVCVAVVLGGVCSQISAEPSATDGKKVGKLPQSIERVLAWLPPETETLFVAHGPMEIPAKDDRKLPKDAGKDLEAYLWSIPVSPLFGLDDEKSTKLLKKHKLALAMEGSCRFRLVRYGPAAVTMYAGCHIFIFDDDLGKDGDSFMKSLAKKADAKDRIAGLDVVRFDRRINAKDVAKHYLIRPKPNVLIVATDRDYLHELLKRMSSEPKTRAFPKDLPHWKQFDPSSRFWAMRRYTNDEVPDAPAKGFILPPSGLVFSYDPKDAGVTKIRSINVGDVIIGPLGKGFGIDPPIEPKVRWISDRVAVSTHRLKDHGSVFAYVMMLHVALGHAFGV